MNQRTRQLIKQFKSSGINALLITDDHSIKYLTEFPASESWLLVTATQSYYITDARYTLHAKKYLKHAIVVEHQGSMAKVIFDLAKARRVFKIGFNPRYITVAQYNYLQKVCPKGISFKEASTLVENLRIIKDNGEVQAIRNGLKLHEEALKFVKKAIRPGRTEWEVFLDLERFVKSHQAGFSFDPIIASGVNSCYPHARVTNRKIQKNDVVMADFGIDLNGYKTDLTRMFYLGRIPNLLREITSYVSVAQQKAIEKIGPGVSVKEVDDAARGYLESHGLAKYFGHSLGHGVGLEIHEAPRLSGKSNEILQPGMVVTVEPAVYLPNKFGVRLEEMVLVTKKGCEVLSGNIN